MVKFFIIVEFKNEGILNSKKSNTFKENRNKIVAIIIKNTGCWNCIPQPILMPRDRKLIRTKANIKKEDTIPTEVIKKLFPIDNLFFERLSTDKIFIERTGKTQGIKFKIIPPTILIINQNG